MWVRGPLNGPHTCMRTSAIHCALSPLSSAAVTLGSGCSPSPVEIMKPTGVEKPQSSAFAGFGFRSASHLWLRHSSATSSFLGRGLRLPAPEVYVLAIPQGAPQSQRAGPRGGGRGARGGRGRGWRGGVPAIKRGRLPRRPGRLGPRRSDGRAPVGTRAVPAERSEALGSPRAGAGAGGGAGPGDAGLGEDGGP